MNNNIWDEWCTECDLIIAFCDCENFEHKEVDDHERAHDVNSL